MNLRAVSDVPATDAFTDAMSAFASGVVLVTSWVDDRPWGTTVTAFASVSVDPPTVLVSLASEGIAARAIAAAGVFGVSILAVDQVALADYASAPGAPKFLEQFLASDGTIAGALAHLDCEVCGETRVADHTILFGRVLNVEAARVGGPLVYHRRNYTTSRSVRCLTN